MTKKVTILMIFSLLFSLFSTQSLVIVQGQAGEVYYSIGFTVTYVNPTEGTKTWNLTEEDRTISLFMNNAWQSVELKSTSHDFETLKNDSDGNDIAVLVFPKQQLLPGENVSYTVEYAVVSKPRAIPSILENESGTLEAIPQGLIDVYTGAEGPWLVNDPELVELAHEIAGNETNVLKIVKGFIGWIENNIDYSGTHEVPFYPNQTLSAREGDCDDQAILFITLSRIIGIPSYMQIGAIYMPQDALVNETFWDNHVQVIQRKIGWHGWAMVYVPPWGWLPVDLTYVRENNADPLSSIRSGAVTAQDTIQYMNITRTDYVALSLRDRAFLASNGFHVYMEDKMTQQTGPSSPTLIIDPRFIIAAIVLIAWAVFASYLISKRLKKRVEEEKPSPPEPHL